MQVSFHLWVKLGTSTEYTSDLHINSQNLTRHKFNIFTFIGIFNSRMTTYLTKFNQQLNQVRNIDSTQG